MSRVPARCATYAGGSRVRRPGAWLHLTALFASASVLLAVISGAASLGAAHRVLAALALPPLLALVTAALLAHRRLLLPALARG